MLRRFADDKEGAGTIEFVIWLPLFIAIILLAFDLSITFYSMSRMWDVARHAARMVSTGQMSALQAKGYAEGQLPGHATYQVDIDDSNTYDVIVNISSGNISPAAGFVIDFSPSTFTASYAMRREAF